MMTYKWILYRQWWREHSDRAPTVMRDTIARVSTQAEAINLAKKNGDGLYFIKHENDTLICEIVIYDGMAEKVKHLC